MFLLISLECKFPVGFLYYSQYTVAEHPQQPLPFGVSCRLAESFVKRGLEQLKRKFCSREGRGNSSPSVYHPVFAISKESWMFEVYLAVR